MTPRILAALAELRDALADHGADHVHVSAHVRGVTETPAVFAAAMREYGTLTCHAPLDPTAYPDTILRTADARNGDASITVIHTRPATAEECAAASAHDPKCQHHWSRRAEIANAPEAT